MNTVCFNELPCKNVTVWHMESAQAMTLITSDKKYTVIVKNTDERSVCVINFYKKPAPEKL